MPVRPSTLRVVAYRVRKQPAADQNDQHHTRGREPQKATIRLWHALKGPPTEHDVAGRHGRVVGVLELVQPSRPTLIMRSAFPARRGRESWMRTCLGSAADHRRLVGTFGEAGLTTERGSLPVAGH